MFSVFFVAMPGLPMKFHELDGLERLMLERNDMVKRQNSRGGEHCLVEVLKPKVVGDARIASPGLEKTSWLYSDILSLSSQSTRQQPGKE